MAKLTYCKASDALVLEDGELTVDDLYNLVESNAIMPIINTGQGDTFLVSTPKGKWEVQKNA